MARAYSALSCHTRGSSPAPVASTTATSVAHVVAIGLPEAAHRGLGGPRPLRLGAFAAHVDDGEHVACGGGAPLDEAAHAAVLHRDIARGPDEVRLLEAPAPHGR